jgi:hypothetical protein
VIDRHEVLKDDNFWLVLEYGLLGWFRTCGDKSLGGFWCDGFIPTFARDTKDGVEVVGTAWIVDGGRSQHRCSFTAAIPQRMLAGRRATFLIAELALDLNRKDLRLAVAPAADPPTSLERTRGR